jgi:hypothetical protein
MFEAIVSKVTRFVRRQPLLAIAAILAVFLVW